MSEDTSPIGAPEITTSRQQYVIETASLRVPRGVDEFYLADLRQLVDIAALIPGDAIVRPRHDGIDITYTRAECVDGAGRFPDADPSEYIEAAKAMAQEYAREYVEAQRPSADQGVTLMSDAALAEVRNELQRNGQIPGGDLS